MEECTELKSKSQWLKNLCIQNEQATNENREEAGLKTACWFSTVLRNEVQFLDLLITEFLPTINSTCVQSNLYTHFSP